MADRSKNFPVLYKIYLQGKTIKKKKEIFILKQFLTKSYFIISLKFLYFHIDRLG